jgi:hypothetical protein
LGGKAQILLKFSVDFRLFREHVCVAKALTPHFCMGGFSIPTCTQTDNPVKPASTLLTF